MTIPTAGSRPLLLNNLIRDSGLPLENIVVAVTKEGVVVPRGVVKILDLDPPNIQRWWNRGVEEATRRGATVVAVVNDDIKVSADTLPLLATALKQTGATITSPSRPPSKDKKCGRPLIPYSPRIWGRPWVLDATSTLRANEKYVWWYGDCDLDIRARRDFGKVVNVHVEFEHLHSGEGTAKSPALLAQSDRDALTHQSEYARLISSTRVVTQLKRFLRITK